MKRWKYIVSAIFALVAVWLLSVDLSWFVHNCPDCGYGKDVAQYRVFTIPIHETTYESLTTTQLVASDLGVPCLHKNSTNWHKHRWWGMLICKSPCINGVYRLTEDNSWYDQKASAKVAAMAVTDKSIADDFVQNVFEKHDFSFVQVVFDRAGVASESSHERKTK